MKSIEHKATEYATDAMSSIVDKYQTAPWNEFRDALAEIYLAGAKEASSLQWISVKDELPEDGEYVLIIGYSGIEPTVYNSYYNCWDSVDGDDFRYEKDEIEIWMRIPKPSETDIKQPDISE